MADVPETPGFGETEPAPPPPTPPGPGEDGDGYEPPPPPPANHPLPDGPGVPTGEAVDGPAIET